jgi:hypothetical protein
VAVKSHLTRDEVRIKRFNFAALEKNEKYINLGQSVVS